VIFEKCERTDKQPDKQADKQTYGHRDHNTLHFCYEQSNQISGIFKREFLTKILEMHDTA